MSVIHPSALYWIIINANFDKIHLKQNKQQQNKDKTNLEKLAFRERTKGAYIEHRAADLKINWNLVWHANRAQNSRVQESCICRSQCESIDGLHQRAHGMIKAEQRNKSIDSLEPYHKQKRNAFLLLSLNFIDWHCYRQCCCCACYVKKMKNTW